MRGLAEFDRDRKRTHGQTIALVESPAHGRIERRPGPVTVGDDRLGSKACRGATLDGIQVFYVPDDGFVGRDRFVLDVTHPGRRRVHAKVDVTVGDDARAAAN